MKKLLLFAFLAFPMAAFAQPTCSPDSTNVWNIEASAVDPNNAPPREAVQDDSPGYFPDMMEGQYYEEVLKFVFARRLDTLGFKGTITSVTVVNVNNLPSGMQYHVISANAGDAAGGGQVILNPMGASTYGPHGCATVYGTVPSGVQTDATDSITIGVVVLVSLNWNFNPGGLLPSSLQDTAEYRVKYVRITGAANSLARSLNYSVSPNPVGYNSVANSTLENTSNVAFQMTDLSGRVVYTQPAQQMMAGAHSFSIPQDLPSGLYLAQLNVNGQVATIKVVK